MNPIFTHSEIAFMMEAVRANRDDSAALAQRPAQRWKAAHEAEVRAMSRLLAKLEGIERESGYCHGLF